MDRIHRPHAIQGYLSDDENQRFRRSVRRQHHTVASFVRAAVMHAVRRDEDESRALETAAAETNRS